MTAAERFDLIDAVRATPISTSTIPRIEPAPATAWTPLPSGCPWRGWRRSRWAPRGEGEGKELEYLPSRSPWTGRSPWFRWPCRTPRSAPWSRPSRGALTIRRIGPAPSHPPTRCAYPIRTWGRPRTRRRMPRLRGWDAVVALH